MARPVAMQPVQIRPMTSFERHREARGDRSWGERDMSTEPQMHALAGGRCRLPRLCPRQSAVEHPTCGLQANRRKGERYRG